MSIVAWYDDVDLVSVVFDQEMNNVEFINGKDNPFIYINNEFITLTIGEMIQDHKIKLYVKSPLPIGQELFITWGEYTIPLYFGAIVRTNWFDKHFSAVENTLSPICENHRTFFSVWAPTATNVKLCLGGKLHPLYREKNGVWSNKIDGDWHGTEYEYEVTANGRKVLVNDPYTRALLPNSEKSVLVNPLKAEKIPNVKRPSRPFNQSLAESIIYELHVRDATISTSSGINQKGKFRGLTERETLTENGYSTGITYLRELGVTHVQLLPINDFARVNELDPENYYNWGYDPLFFQVPEGSYSTIPKDPMNRIVECKEMIDSFHQEGMSVIVDVVFNHVYKMEESPFEKLVPGYYFRYHEDGSLSNGTGVGNDFASERLMGRQFILNSVMYWLEEFMVDGFRFDLMGALDIETMKEIERLCKDQGFPVMLLGEGWNLPTALSSEHQKASITQAHELSEVSFFNDYFRDTLKGNLFHLDDKGYVNGNGKQHERLPFIVTGSCLENFGEPIFHKPCQSINYVECHDNHTLYDRLCITNSDHSVLVKKKMHQLATGLTILSQGIPFLHAGQEWFRTKNGDGNSYISGDQINALDWNRREEEDENIYFVKALITMRKRYDVFRLTIKEEIRRRFHLIDAPIPVFGYVLAGEDGDFVIIANPTDRCLSIQLPSSGIWLIAVSNDTACCNNLIKGEFTEIKAYEFTVLKKNR